MANRYFVDPLPRPGTAELAGDVAHHLARVLRAAPGERVTLGDGRGRQCVATVERVRGRAVTVVVEPATEVRRGGGEVHLAFAPPRQTRADWLLEHGTEVGVAVFRPLVTARTRPLADRTERWQKIVRAAAGQCDRAFLPEVLRPCALDALLAEPGLPRRRFLAAAGAPPPPSRCAEPCVLLVGPEGGLAPDEQQAATLAGFVPVGLGPHVLRTETAALVGAALLVQAATEPPGAGTGDQ